MRTLRILMKICTNIGIRNGQIRSKKSVRHTRSSTLELTPTGLKETIHPDTMQEDRETLTMTSEYHYLIDNGHGGLIDGVYQTAGKRSPMDPETGEVLYEGVNNRINARLIVNELKRMRISASLLVPEAEDISLAERIKRANDEQKKRKCILLSIHSNASGNGKDWANAKGISLHIANKRSKTTDILASIMEDEFKQDFEGLTRWRGVKFDDFYMTRKSSSPSILCEIGFHDNLEEARKMVTDEWRNLLVKSISHAIIIFEDATPKVRN